MLQRNLDALNKCDETFLATDFLAWYVNRGNNEWFKIDGYGRLEDWTKRGYLVKHKSRNGRIAFTKTPKLLKLKQGKVEFADLIGPEVLRETVYGLYKKYGRLHNIPEQHGTRFVVTSEDKLAEVVVYNNTPYIKIAEQGAKVPSGKAIKKTGKSVLQRIHWSVIDEFPEYPKLMEQVIVSRKSCEQYCVGDMPKDTNQYLVIKVLGTIE